MEIKPIANRRSLEYDVQKTFKVDGCSLTEFVSYVSKFVNEDKLEVIFFYENNYAYAYIVKNKEMYIFGDEPLAAPVEPKEIKSTSKVQEAIDKSKLFASSLIVFVMVLASCLPIIQ